MKNWQVTYKSLSGKQVTKFYASMNTATLAVGKLGQKGIEASCSPVWQGGNDV